MGESPFSHPNESIVGKSYQTLCFSSRDGSWCVATDSAVKDWGRYELVSTPADADLVLQIHVADLTGSYDELRLTLLDPKSNVTLWTLSEHAAKVGSQKARDVSFDRAMSLISDDLKKLAAGPTTATQSVGKK